MPLPQHCLLDASLVLQTFPIFLYSSTKGQLDSDWMFEREEDRIEDPWIMSDCVTWLAEFDELPWFWSYFWSFLMVSSCVIF